jgi:Abnormal spindle-like microcephaly-assoc'd, ASPM-SPD-2-Hydin/Beta-propeller repeat
MTSGKSCLCFVLLGALFPAAPRLRAQGQEADRSALPAVREVQGETRSVKVPMVSEPWSATASLEPVAPADARRRANFIGYFPGFKEAKEKANRALLERLHREGMQKGRSPEAAPSAPQINLEAPASALTVFDGPSESDTTSIPPDPQIAAGPSHIVVVINSLMGIYSKTGTRVGGFQQLSSFFSKLNLTGDIYDPRILYDQVDNRFILSAGDVNLTNFAGGNVVLAVSQTSDPTGVWNKYALNFRGKDINSDTSTIPDFPTLGLSSSAVYVSTSQFVADTTCIQTGACSFSDTWIEVVGLPALLSGGSTLNITTFKNVLTASGKQAFSIEPALTYGSAPAEFLAAAEAYSSTETTLNLFSITTTGTPALSAADLTVPGFSIPPNAPQPGTGALIDTNDYRLLNAVWKDGSLWCGQNALGSTGGNSAGRWYEISLASLADAALVQSGELNGAGAAYFPAVALKADGSLGIAFTTSSAQVPASSAYTMQLPGDAAGSTRGYALYRAGGGPYAELGDNRWGDYSGSSEDPDGASIWMFSEYARRPDPNAHFGTAVARIAGPPELSASPSSIDFGSVLTGSTSPPKTVTVTNNGSDPVALGQLALQGTNSGIFMVSSDLCSNITLAAGQTCTADVGYSPTAIERDLAFLAVPYDSGNSLATVGVSGSGVVEAILTYSAATLTFADTPLYTSSASQVITVQNVGNASAQIYTLNVYPSSFIVTTDCGSGVAAGASCQITVKFHPLAAGLLSGTVGFLASGVVPPPVSLSGTGIKNPAAVLCPVTLGFSSQLLNSTSAARSVIVTNSGTATLTITSVEPSGDFATSSDCVTSLAPRAACTITVTFTPTAAGTRSGTVSVTDNAAGSPQTATLTGTGVTSASALRERAAATDPLLPAPSAAAVSPKAESPEGRRILDAERPLYFEPNLGQFDSGVEFVSRFQGSAVAVTSSGMVLRLAGHATANQKPSKKPPAKSSPAYVDVSLAGANPHAKARGGEELLGRSNYFIGRDPHRWITNAPSYARVNLHNVYPGVDLTYYGNQRMLEYDFVVAPGADPKAIRLRFSAKSGRLKDKQTPELRVAPNGDLVIATDSNEARLRKPIVYQPTTDGRVSRQGEWELLGPQEAAFRLGLYDRENTLVIDPVLVFSTFLGGSGGDTANAIAVDSQGNAYITGQTSSVDFPVTDNAFQKNCGTPQRPCAFYLTDAFVAKMSADGSTLLYATYLGGTDNDGSVASGITVDSTGNAFISGTTTSNDFPTTSGSFQSQCPNSGSSYKCLSAFVTKLDPTGSSIVYSTYLGSPSPYASSGPVSSTNAIAVDSAGEAYVAGRTVSKTFPTTPGAFQTAGPQPQTGIGFVSKLNATGSGLVFSTYIGGSGNDGLTSIVLDSSGNAYVAGYAGSLDFPTTSGAYQTSSGGSGEGIVAKFSSSGALVYSTYLGGSAGDSIAAIALDGDGTAYVTGRSNSGGIPVTPGGNASPPSSPYPAFVAKLHPAGCALLLGTYLDTGNSYDAEGHAITLDTAGNIYVAGGLNEGTSGGGIVSYSGVNALQPSLSLSPGFVTELDPSGLKVLFSTPLGGTGSNYVSGMALSSAGDIYLAGQTFSPDFPAVNAWDDADPAFGGDYPSNPPHTAYVARISPAQATGVSFTRTALNFPPLPTNYEDNPVFQMVGLINHTFAPLNISSLKIIGSAFTQSSLPSPPPACSGSIAPGAGCAVRLGFLPTTMGPIDGTLTITDDGPGSPRTVALHGMGVADFRLNPQGPSPNPVLTGENAQYTVYVETPYGAPLLSGNINLTCADVSPAVCSFNPSAATVIGSTSSSILTVSNLAAVAGGRLNFSVVGTLGNQTDAKPLSLTVEDFALGATPASAPVTAGQSASYTLTVTPINGFNLGTFFVCSGVPAYASCSVSPQLVTPDGTNPSTATLTVTTTAPSGLPGRGPRIAPPLLVPGAQAWRIWMLFWLGAVGVLAGLASRGRRWPPAWLAMATTLLVLVLWASCGGGGGSTGGGGGGGGSKPGTPAGTYTITVSASASTLSHTTTVSLTVQ